jgi:hypothetical protein
MQSYYVVRHEEPSTSNAGDRPIDILDGPYKTRRDAELWIAPAKKLMGDRSHWSKAETLSRAATEPKWVYYVAEFCLPKGVVLSTRLVSVDISEYGVSQYAGLMYQAKRDSGLEL